MAQPSAGSDEQKDWRAVTELSRSGGQSGSGSSAERSKAQIEAQAQAQLVQSKQLAASARAFYTTHPTSQNAGEAKKIEAVASLKGVSGKDSDKGEGAFQTAQTFRSDKSQPVADRCEVAALMERQKYSVQNAGKVLAKDPQQHERVADSLRSEFGDIPEVYAFYLGVVNTSDPESAFKVAQRIQQLPAPDHAKAEAKATIDRHNLIGKKLTQPFRDADGKPLVLSEVGKPTVVLFWSPVTTPSALRTLARLKLPTAEGARWVYVAKNATAGSLDLTKKQAPYPGIHCLELPTSVGPFTAELKNRRLPYVYVLGRDGSMVGYGDFDDLGKLLQAAK